ncbi:MAG: hypothetical protein ABEK59_10775 [Halobacteria archaeon]
MVQSNGYRRWSQDGNNVAKSEKPGDSVNVSNEPRIIEDGTDVKNDYVIGLNSTTGDFSESQVERMPFLRLANNITEERSDTEIRSLVYRMWIVRESYLPRKINMKIDLDIENRTRLDDGGELQVNADMDVNLTVRFLDYGEEITVDLPEGTKNAVDLDDVENLTQGDLFDSSTAKLKENKDIENKNKDIENRINSPNKIE